MTAITAQQMKAIDRTAVERLGIPSAVLMENAGRGAAGVIFKMLRRIERPKAVIVCGPGNNGGDGFVTARHLMIHGIRPTVFVLAAENALKGDAVLNARILKQLKLPLKFQHPSAAELKKADLVIDAIFGIGLSREITGAAREVIEQINTHACRVIALDIPSGLDANTGAVHGICVKARVTVTFHQEKKGLRAAGARRYAGRIVTVPIGFPVKGRRGNGGR